MTSATPQDKWPIRIGDFVGHTFVGPPHDGRVDEGLEPSRFSVMVSMHPDMAQYYVDLFTKVAMSLKALAGVDTGDLTNVADDIRHLALALQSAHESGDQVSHG